MLKTILISCPDYTFDENLDLEKVGNCIDEALIDNFQDKQVVLRGVQSDKHELDKEQLIQQIIETGSDRYESDNVNEVKVSNEQIDFFGYACTINNAPIVLPILEGFHKWKPKSLERPQRKVDTWMVYEASQLENVEYSHSHYGVNAKDGYIIKESKNKTDALLGLIILE